MGFFTSHARHPAIGSTASSGQAELLQALANIDLRRKGVTAAEVARALNPRQPATAGVTTALNAISATLVTAGGGTYKLTRLGLKTARRSRPRPHFPWGK